MLDTSPCRQEGRVDQDHQLRWRPARRHLQCSGGIAGILVLLLFIFLGYPYRGTGFALLSAAPLATASAPRTEASDARADSLIRSPVYVGSKMTTTSTLSTVGTAPTSSVTISRRRETKGHQPVVSTITISTLRYLISIDSIKPISTTLILRSLRQGW